MGMWYGGVAAALLVLIDHASATYITKVFGVGVTAPKTDDCTKWSEYGGCYATNNRPWLYEQLPKECYKHHQIKLMTQFGKKVYNNLMDVSEKLNTSQSACGMCNTQISCSTTCRKQEDDDETVLGIAERVCDDLRPEVEKACAISSDAIDRKTGECRPWPPKGYDKQDFAPDYFPESYRDALWDGGPFNCIAVGIKCYCCCPPYAPDPCTALCKQPGDVCDSREVFTLKEVIKLRRNYARNKLGGS